MAWQTPKTNWGVDPVGPGDFNRIEGNIKALADGEKAAGDANKLGGLLPNYYVTRMDLEKIRSHISVVSLGGYGRHMIKHGMGSTNLTVVVDYAYDDDGSSGWASAALVAGYKIIDANTVLIQNRKGHDTTLRVSIIRIK